MGKKKLKVRRKAQGRDRHQPKGFDFGIDDKVALIGAMEFQGSLHRAGVVGCAYGESFEKGFRRPLPIVSLIGTDRTALEEAFREFHRWDEATHGDALDLTFVFLNAGAT